MHTLTITADIVAPAERVFQLATDFERSPDIIDAIDSVEMLSDPPHSPARVGTRFRETRTMFGKQATEEMEVTAISPPGADGGEAGSYTIEAHSHGTHYVTLLAIEPIDAERCRFAMTFNVRPEKLAAKLLSPLGGLMMKQVRKALEKDVQDIKRAAEGERAHEAEPSREPTPA